MKEVNTQFIKCRNKHMIMAHYCPGARMGICSCDSVHALNKKTRILSSDWHKTEMFWQHTNVTHQVSRTSRQHTTDVSLRTLVQTTKLTTTKG